MSQGNKLKSFNPFLDEGGVLWVRGRLRKGDLNFAKSIWQFCVKLINFL